MISKAQTVEAYLAELPADRKPALDKLRVLCRKTLRDYEECMEYGMPVYKRGGAAEIAIASQKQYIALYVMKKDVVDAFRDQLPSCSIGKGCIRFTHANKIDFDTVEQILITTFQATSKPC